MNVRRRFLSLTVLAILAAAAAAAVVLASLYRVGLAREGESLARMVQSQAALSQAVFDTHLEMSAGDTAAALSETLGHLRAALAGLEGLGDFGGLTVSRRSGDTLFVEIKMGVDTGLAGDPIVLPSSRMLVAQRAIAGESSVVRGERDHRGVPVLAAYAPVPGAGLGIIAKVDLADARRPYVSAALFAAALASLLVLAALVVARSLGTPVLARMEEQEAAHQALAAHFPGILFRALHAGGGMWRFQLVEGAVLEITGYPAEHFMPEGRAWLDLIHPDDRPAAEARWRDFAAGRPVEGPWDYRIVRADGREAWVRARARLAPGAAAAAQGERAVAGVVVDVTTERQAVEAGRRAEDQLAALVEQLPGAAVLVLDMDLRVLFGAGELLQHLGVGAGQLSGVGLEEVFEPEAVERALAARDGVLAGEDRRYEEVIAGRTLRILASSIDASGHEPARILVLALDVTEQRRREAELEASEARFQAFMDANPAVAWIKDEGGRHLYGSRAWERLYGFEGRSWQGRTEYDIAPAPQADRWRREDDEVLRTGRTLSFVEETVGADGTLRAWQVVKFPLTGPGGERLVAGMALDVTRERASEQARLASEERLRLALEAGKHGLYDLDLRSGEAIVNAEYARMLGYDPATFVETNAAWRERIHPEDRDAVYAEFQAYVAGERDVYSVEHRQRTADGGWRWVLSIGEIVERDAQGRPVRMLGTHTDIHERKTAEEQVRAHRDELRRWQAVMLDREERVQELKREVNLLCVRAGEAPRYTSQEGREA